MGEEVTRHRIKRIQYRVRSRTFEVWTNLGARLTFFEEPPFELHPGKIIEISESEAPGFVPVKRERLR